MIFAWHIESSEIVAFIFLVKSLKRLWNSFIFSDTSNVDCLPSSASFLSFSERLVTSSRINSFSSNCSFLLFSLSYKMLIFASKASSSGSSPTSCLHLFSFSGSSSFLESSFSLLWVSWIYCWSSNTFSASLGTVVSLSLPTFIFLSISAISILIIRI